PALEAIREQFGDAVLADDGRLDRRKLRSIVFGDDGKRRHLESLLHPRIRERVSERINELEAVDTLYAIIAVPLLVETGFDKLVDRVLVVDCNVETQLQRLTARDDIGEAEAHAMIDAQISRETRLAAADDVVDNSGDLAATRAQVEPLHLKYRD